MEQTTNRAYPPGEHPDMKPPIGQSGVLYWLHKNLFSTPFNVALTLLTAYFLYQIVPPLFSWLMVDSVFVADSRDHCRELGSGACWGFIGKRLGQFTYGFYPHDELYFSPVDDEARANTKTLTNVLLFVWLFVLIRLQNIFFSYDVDVGLSGLGNTTRTVVTLLLIGLTVLPLFRGGMSSNQRGLWATGFFALASLWHFFGGTNFGFSSNQLLSVVETDQFGGFMLTMVIGVTGIVVSLPLGILLALGRQSDLHIIRWMCTGFIEFIRGVPLIALLFVASTMLNYFLPPGSNFDLLLRVLIMVVLFSAAYLAEVVRGGLQAIPKGQMEVADAMGLRYWQSMRLVVLPQALKISIPGIVNTFIGLFKDTTLVVIIGLLDPLGIGRASLSDTKWQGLSTEVYVFIALFFFICCFGMSRYSIYLEKKLHTGHREE